MNKTRLMELAYYDHYKKSSEFIAVNVYVKRGSECDLLRINKNGYCTEIEIKTTVADFKADFKKTVGRYKKHDILARGEHFCNRFYFLVPVEIADKIELPSHSGLLVWDGRKVTEKRTARMLHKNKIGLEEKYRIAKKFIYRYWSKHG